MYNQVLNSTHVFGEIAFSYIYLRPHFFFSRKGEAIC